MLLDKYLWCFPECCDKYRMGVSQAQKAKTPMSARGYALYSVRPQLSYFLATKPVYPG